MSEPPKKRKKVSGLTGLELRMALTALKSVKSSLAPRDNPNVDDAALPQSEPELFALGSEFEETLDKMVEMMQSKVDGPQVCYALDHLALTSREEISLQTQPFLLQSLSFSSARQHHLKALNIKVGGSLRSKSDFETRVAVINNLGAGEHWSAEGLYRHLQVLQALVPQMVSV